MRRPLCVLVLVFALVAGACGGGGGGAKSAYCKGLKNAAADALKSTSTSAANMAALQASFDAALGKISKHAPSELKDDYKVLKEYVDLRFQAVVDPSKAASLQGRLTAITPKYSEAQKNISDYNTKTCKFSAPTATTIKATATTVTTTPATTTTKKK
jgi:hypothetical protein